MQLSRGTDLLFLHILVFYVTLQLVTWDLYNYKPQRQSS